MNTVEEIRKGIPGHLKWKDKHKIPCLDCGSERWVQVEYIRAESFKGWCKECRSKHRVVPRYYRDSSARHKLDKLVNGYVMISIPPDDPLIGMANQSRIILEHRLVVAEALGRLLNRREIVHHINRVKDDNRIGNLTVVSTRRHEQLMTLERRIDYLERVLKKNNISFNGDNLT